MSPSAPSPSTRGELADAALLALDTALTVGAALRVTRFATTDVLGGWVLSDPLHRLADRREPGRPFGYAAPPSAPLHRLVSALDCPFCVGTQAALAIGAVMAATSSRAGRLPRRSPLGRAVRAAAASLAAAYVVGPVAHRLDGAPTPSATPSTPSTPSTPTARTKDSK